MATRSMSPIKLKMNLNGFFEVIILKRYSILNTATLNSSMRFKINSSSSVRSGRVANEKLISEVMIKIDHAGAFIEHAHQALLETERDLGEPLVTVAVTHLGVIDLADGLGVKISFDFITEARNGGEASITSTERYLHTTFAHKVAAMEALQNG